MSDAVKAKEEEEEEHEMLVVEEEEEEEKRKERRRRVLRVKWVVSKVRHIFCFGLQSQHTNKEGESVRRSYTSTNPFLLLFSEGHVFASP